MELALCILYGSLLLELIFFHVPSVANTQVFFNNDPSVLINYNNYQYVFKWSKQQKVLYLIIPHILNILAFFFPLLMVFFHKNAWNTMATIGVFIAILGRLFSFYAMLQIRKNNSQENGQFELHTNEIFSISRNPIQLGMYLFYIGICMINFEYFLLIPFLIYFFYNDFRIKIEEDFLEVKFKEAYFNYKFKTRRYL
jgi:protein-S-isoprenylcysteine O-methyltransferase Ste14